MIPGELVLILGGVIYLVGHVIGAADGVRRYRIRLRHAARHAPGDQIALATLERAMADDDERNREMMRREARDPRRF